MKFELDAVFVEHGCAGYPLATRILGALARDVPVTHVADDRARRPGPYPARAIRSAQANGGW